MIDIIIPAYNAHSTIGYTIASIVSQTIKDKIKITIVNDCSTEDYSYFIKLFSPFIRIQEIQMLVNGGPGMARKIGVNDTYYPYMMFIDADDIYVSVFSVSELFDRLEKDKDACMISGNFLEEVQSGKAVEHKNDMTWVFGKMYRRSYWDKHKLNFSDLRSNEDSELNTHLHILNKIHKDAHVLNYKNSFFYLWRYKADSITKINNFEYSFNSGLIGFIHAKTNVLRAEIFYIHEEFMLEEILTVFVDNYWNLMTIQKYKSDNPEFYDNVFHAISVFYQEFGEYLNEIPMDFVAKILNTRPNGFKDTIVPNILFQDYMELVAKEAERLDNLT